MKSPWPDREEWVRVIKSYGVLVSLPAVLRGERPNNLTAEQLAGAEWVCGWMLNQLEMWVEEEGRLHDRIKDLESGRLTDIYEPLGWLRKKLVEDIHRAIGLDPSQLAESDEPDR